MLRLIGIMISIGFADSLNPTTIAPALFLAAGERPRDSVAKFTIGVFLVYFLGGAIIALGPGQLLLSLVPKPDRDTRQVLEVVAGAVLLAAGGLLYRYRGQLEDKNLPEVDADSHSSLFLGATITAVELPTAFPYFGAIAAVVGSGLDPARQVLLLFIFNVFFVLPLVAIIATLWRFGNEAQAKLSRARDFLQRHWPVLLAAVALIAGTFTIVLGATGIARRHHSHFGRLVRRFGHLLSA